MKNWVKIGIFVTLLIAYLSVLFLFVLDHSKYTIIVSGKYYHTNSYKEGKNSIEFTNSDNHNIKVNGYYTIREN